MSSFCNKCGKEVEENKLLCEECEKIATPSQTTSNVQVKRKKKISKKKIIIIAICVFFILIFSAIMSTPDIVSIEAAYYGDTKAGIVIDNENEGISVTGTDENGEKRELSSWEIKNPKTLVADESATVIINYGELETSLEIECTTSKVKELIVEYTGDREEGVIVTKNSAGLKVLALHKNGEKTDVTEKCELLNEVEFKANKSVKIEVKYTDPANGKEFVESKTVKCSTFTIESISAKYTGSKEEGTVLDEKNDGIVVTAKYKDGSKEEVKGWKIKEATSLKADKTSTVTITYEGKKCTLEVVCSTMSKSTYMAKCKSISYNELARNPKKYEGQLVKFTGEVIQVQEAQS